MARPKKVLPPMPIDGSVAWTHPLEPNFLIGRLDMLGISFHVEAVRMRKGRDAAAGFDSDNAERAKMALDFIRGEDDITPHRVKIPKMPGEWLLWITPYCD